MNNIIIYDGHEYMTEYIWRNKYDDNTRDSKGNVFPYPIEGNGRETSDKFIDKLEKLNEQLEKKKKYYLYKKSKKCLLCDKPNISNKIFYYNGVMWEDSINHYIKNHNIEPSNMFKNHISQKNILKHTQKKDNNNKNIIAQKIKHNDNDYVKIDRNQLLILDALMIHGGYGKKYIDNMNKSTRYSEHSGYLDFENKILTKIVVSGNTTRIDMDDDEIYLPINMTEMLNYEYIFHTHPPTPKPGGRVKDGILYEVPSVSDIFHFIDHHNEGNVIGSLVVAAEGLYNIRKYDTEVSDIDIDEDRLFKDYQRTFDKIQRESIREYGNTFKTSFFYSVIAQNTKYINILNKTLNTYDIQIDFYPRKRDKNNRWYIDTLYLVFRENKKR